MNLQFFLSVYFLLAASLSFDGEVTFVIFLLLTVKFESKLDPSFLKYNILVVKANAEIASFNCSKLTES